MLTPIEVITNVPSGKFFRVCFQKKDGSIEWRTVRLEVTSYLKGGTQPYDPASKGLVTVADVDKMKRLKKGVPTDANGKPIKSPYINLNLAGVKEIRCGGKVYRF